ncbi:lysophospholipid acyltransferase family protein [Capnocytophaga sp. ARDL2]|uniref:lysophospholipid acyltransferase family protein n=1 Tax=Capnocytophaga sp. ARDL2 TaxID=3238809 RepID=UPI0035573CFF
MQKLLSYPLSVLYYICLGLSLVIFHPIQWFCLKVFGYQSHKKSVDILQWFLMRSANVLGTTFSVTGKENLPKERPLIFVCNHQSMFDIVSIIWFLQEAHPKFVSKIELGKGIPSVSFNLKYGGSALIDRNDPKQALSAIRDLAKYIQTNKRSAVIFPEGTRSKTGKPKRFSENGLKMLCKFAPNAMVVPLTINNSWKIFRYGSFPMGLGSAVKLHVHPAIKIKDMEFEQLLETVENTVKSKIEE